MSEKGRIDCYRYGYQGQEKDDEIKGNGNSVNYTYRMHDPRLGRFFAVDPLSDKYPYNSPYAFSENVVINAIELECLEKFTITERGRFLHLTLIDVTADFEVINMVDANNVTSHKNFVYKDFHNYMDGWSVNKNLGELKTKYGTYRHELNNVDAEDVYTPQFSTTCFSRTKITFKSIPNCGSLGRATEQTFSSSLSGDFGVFTNVINEDGTILRPSREPENYDYIRVYVNPNIISQDDARILIQQQMRADSSTKEIIFENTTFGLDERWDDIDVSGFDFILDFGEYE